MDQSIFKTRRVHCRNRDESVKSTFEWHACQLHYVLTSFMNNLMNPPNISMTSSIMKVSPVMIVAWRWSSVAINVVGRLVVVRQGLTVILTPHQVACFYTHYEFSCCFEVCSSYSTSSITWNENNNMFVMTWPVKTKISLGFSSF